MALASRGEYYIQYVEVSNGLCTTYTHITSTHRQPEAMLGMRLNNLVPFALEPVRSQVYLLHLVGRDLSASRILRRSNRQVTLNPLSVVVLAIRFTMVW